jgi:hypothetical protein
MSTMKKYGTREQVLNGEAEMTKSKITKDQMQVVDGKIKTLKEIEQQEIRKQKLQAKKEEAPPSPVDEESSQEGVKAVPRDAYNLADLKELVNTYIKDNDRTLPRGTSKWKKADWKQCAVELNLI